MDAPLMSISWRRGQDTPAPTAPPRLAATVLAERLAHFWAMDHRKPFSAPETRLFCYWLHQFHAAGWPSTLPGREQLVAAYLNMSAKVLTLARVGLVGRGLLIYEASAAGRAAEWGLSAHWAGLTASTPTTPHH